MWCRAVLPAACCWTAPALLCSWCFPIFQPSFCVSLSPQCLEYCLNPNITKLHVITVEWQHCITTTTNHKLLYFCDQDVSVMLWCHNSVGFLHTHVCVLLCTFFTHKVGQGAGRCQATRSNNSRELVRGGPGWWSTLALVVVAATLEWPLE